MKIRAGFVTNSSSSSFIIIFHSDERKHRLHKALGIIPDLGGVPIACRSLDEAFRQIDEELAEEEKYYQWMRGRKDQTEEDIEWNEKWHKLRVKEIESRQRLLNRHKDGGAIVWITEPIEDQGGTYQLYQKLDEHGTANGMTILHYREDR